MDKKIFCDLFPTALEKVTRVLVSSFVMDPDLEEFVFFDLCCQVGKVPIISLFSGVAGLDLAMSKFIPQHFCLINYGFHVFSQVGSFRA